MGRLIRAFDWSETPLGRPSEWPQALKTLVNLLLASKQPMFLGWGPDRTWLYNDAFIPILGRKHPAALGRPSPHFSNRVAHRASESGKSCFARTTCADSER
jgi:hypothetical protein